MPSLQSIAEKYPLISVATVADQSEIFAILDKTSIVSGGIQIGFDRRPDFFEVLKSQAPKFLVFLMHNEDGKAHGLAVMSFRPMQKSAKNIFVGYGSDLRTTRELSKAAHLQWRKMYAEVITNLKTIPELQQADLFLTAVWDSNILAQRALVKKNSRLEVIYDPIDAYRVCSVVSRLWRKKTSSVRQLKSSEIPLIKSMLVESNDVDEITWETAELERTLKQLSKKFEDFLVHEINGVICSICLPVDKVPGRITKILALPKKLIWLTKIAKFLFDIDIKMGQELKTKYMMFFRTLDPAKKYSELALFIHAAQNADKEKNRSDRAQIYVVSLWNEHRLSRELWKRGFINTEISAKLYEVRPNNGFAPQNVNTEQLEVALL